MADTTTLTPDQIKEARETLGMNQKELAEAIGIAEAGTISRWENGHRSIPFAHSELIRRMLREHQQAATK